jgi:hypothetical protein
MTLRRAWLCAVVSLVAASCSLLTNIPDLTSGSLGDSDASDAGDARDASDANDAGDVGDVGDVGDAGDAGDATDFCAPYTFTYDPKGRELNSVHVGGSFNGFPKTIAAGGWPLAKTGATWTLTRDLPAGRNLYKLVLNESEWILDPANPNTVPDGHGNTNSFIDSTCPDH